MKFIFFLTFSCQTKLCWIFLQQLFPVTFNWEKNFSLGHWLSWASAVTFFCVTSAVSFLCMCNILKFVYIWKYLPKVIPMLIEIHCAFFISLRCQWFISFIEKPYFNSGLENSLHKSKSIPASVTVGQCRHKKMAYDVGECWLKRTNDVVPL